MNLTVPILTLAGLGIVFGLGLAVAAKRFCAPVDPRLEEIFSKLPQANCGACGMAGCMGFAEGLIKGSCNIQNCAVLEDESRTEIAGILGVESSRRVKTVAVLHCHGGSKRVKDKFIYQGRRDCISANLVMAGPKQCVYGCIGFATCVASCPFGAISMNEEDLPVVNEDKCTACGRCVEICPKQLFSLVAADKTYAVRCKSRDLGKKVMAVCAVGCIACRKCEKSCPTGAIRVVDNLAAIDYSICANQGECFKACPTKAIVKKIIVP